MKRVPFLTVLLALLLSACAPKATPTTDPALIQASAVAAAQRALHRRAEMCVRLYRYDTATTIYHDLVQQWPDDQRARQRRVQRHVHNKAGRPG